MRGGRWLTPWPFWSSAQDPIVPIRENTKQRRGCRSRLTRFSPPRSKVFAKSVHTINKKNEGRSLSFQRTGALPHCRAISPVSPYWLQALWIRQFGRADEQEHSIVNRMNRKRWAWISSSAFRVRFGRINTKVYSEMLQWFSCGYFILEVRDY